MNRTQRHQQFREAELKPISMKDIQKRFRAEATRDGNVWVIKHNGVEIRNKSRQEALNDLATINGFKVERGQ